MSDKTEEPTTKRLTKAREEGDSGISANAAQAVAFAVAAVLLPAITSAAAARMSSELRAAIAHAGDTAPNARIDAIGLAGVVGALTLPVLVATGVTAAVAHVVQSGGFIATKKLTPKLDHLNVIQGLKGLVSTTRMFTVLRSLVAGSLVAYMAYRELVAHVADLARLPGRVDRVGVVAGVIGGALIRDAALLGLALGAIDLFVTRYSWMKKLRMSKDEIKREHKESDGNPETKAARDRAHHEMLASATVGNVRTAQVVVVNPTHIACALRYDDSESGGDEAPVVVACGEGDLAARIIRAAHDYNVPVVRDVPLARALRELEVGDAIPEALYEAVAEILREVWDDASKEGGALL